MDMFDKMGQEEPDKTDELGDIRRQYEQAELEERLKTVLFGGYSKKKVNEIISTYKEMIDLALIHIYGRLITGINTGMSCGRSGRYGGWKTDTGPESQTYWI